MCMRSLTYVDIRYMRFCLCQCKWSIDFIFHETNFENSKKLESIVNIFVVFKKISCQSKESLLSKQSPPFNSTPLFLEKILHPHFYCQIRGSQPHPFVKRGRKEGSNYDLLYSLKQFYLDDRCAEFVNQPVFIWFQSFVVVQLLIV